MIVFVNVRKHKLEGKRLIFTDKERQIRPPKKPEVNIELKSFDRSPFRAAIPHVFTKFLTKYAVLFLVKKV